MKIFYSAENRLGADVQLYRFLQNLPKEKHQIKIAGYIKSTQSFSHIDWTLDALHNERNYDMPGLLISLFNHTNIPRVAVKEAETLLEDVNEYNPDLIISDNEPISAHIAQSLNKKLWYCSPIHLLDGIEWQQDQRRYMSTLDRWRRFLSRLPEAEKIFVYAPYGDLKNAPPLKSGYEWITPYHAIGNGDIKNSCIAIIKDKNRKLAKILNTLPFKTTVFSDERGNYLQIKIEDINNIELYQNYLTNIRWFFTTGETTSYLADAIYNGAQNICIAPTIKDTEAVLNAVICRNWNVGTDLGQIELMELFASEQIEKTYHIRNSFGVAVNRHGALHEKIEQLCM